MIRLADKTSPEKRTSVQLSDCTECRQFDHRNFMGTGTLGMLRGMLKRGRWVFPIRNDLMMDKVFLKQGHS